MHSNSFIHARIRGGRRWEAAGDDAGADAGFTLIELMVVLLILGILLAIALPTFLGTTTTANDRAAQSDLNTALTAAKSLATQNGQSYTGGDAPVTLATLADTLRPLVAAQGGTVIVNADSDAPNGVVVQAMLQGRAAGAEKFLFAVRRE